MTYKLNLASGTDIRDGWVNLDVVKKWPCARRGCDIIWDAGKNYIPFPDNSANEIYAGYLLLHLAPCYHKQILAEIYRVLSDDGIVMFGEVDMRIVMTRYMEDPSIKNFSELIWGEQGSFHGNDFTEFDKHCQGFTEESLIHLLKTNGFTDFNRINIHSSDVYYELTIACRKI